MTLESLERMCGFDISPEEYDTTCKAVNYFFDELDAIVAEEAEPMCHGIDVMNFMADDEAGDELLREEALKNAPKTDGQHFLVPNMLQ